MTAPEVPGRATDQSLLTVIAAVRSDAEAALRSLLARRAAELPPFSPAEKGSALPLEQMATIHFARWLVLPGTTDLAGRRIGPQLVMAIVHDGPRAAFVAALEAAMGEALCEIFAHCEDYRPDAGLSHFLLAHVNEPAAFFVSARWRPALLVRAEAELRDHVERCLDAAVVEGTLPQSADGIRDRLRQWIAGSERWRWALSPAPRPSAAVRMRSWGVLAALGLAGVPLLPVLIPGVVALLVCIRAAERHEARAAGPPSPGPTVGEANAIAAEIEGLLTYSGYFVQNQLSLVSLVKPGKLRAVVLRLVLGYVRFRTAYIDVFGKLDGLPSVHFAHWNLIDDGRRLLFLSNYDGTWEAYLGDFVDFAYKGLNAIWSNVVGFPATRWLALRGASSAQRMVSFVGSQEVPCSLWWAAYPSLSVLNVENDIAIREGLAAPTLPDRQAWLRRF